MKKIVSMLLAVAMVASLAACGGGTTSSTPSTSTPSASTPSTSTPSASAPSTSAPASSEPAAPAEPVTVTIGMQHSIQVGDYKDNDFTRWLENAANVNLEFISYDGDNGKTQFATDVAGGNKLPDIMYDVRFSDEEILMYGQDGYFMDLREYFEGDLAADWRARAEELYGKDFYKKILAGWSSADGGVYGGGYVAIGWLEQNFAVSLAVAYVLQQLAERLSLVSLTCLGLSLGVVVLTVEELHLLVELVQFTSEVHLLNLLLSGEFTVLSVHVEVAKFLVGSVTCLTKFDKSFLHVFNLLK